MTKADNKVTIDARRLINLFGGVSAMTEKMSFYKKISRSGVEKWRERSAMPSDALLLLLVIAKNEEVDLDLTDFIKWPEDNDFL